MAEFCINCINKLITNKNNKLDTTDVITETGLCEGCGKIKPCIIKVKRKYRYKLPGGNDNKRYTFWKHKQN